MRETKGPQTKRNGSRALFPIPLPQRLVGPLVGPFLPSFPDQPQLRLTPV